MAPLTLLERVLALPSVPFVTRQRRLPDAPGLYFVIRDDTEILYIGMSRKSIQRRWKTWHHVVCDVEDNGLRERARIAFIVYAKTKTDRLQDDERAAVWQFRPPFNSRHGLLTPDDTPPLAPGAPDGG